MTLNNKTGFKEFLGASNEMQSEMLVEHSVGPGGMGYDRYLARTDHSTLLSKSIRFMAQSTLLTQDVLKQQKIIYPGMQDPSLADRFRELRTKLLSLSNGNNKITLLTSAVPKSGTTHICLNLAAAFAFDFSKTALLIDGNIRKSALHHRFLLEPKSGLTDFLEEEVLDLDEIIYATGIDRLRLIPAGGRNESSGELLASVRMRALLDVLKNRYTDRHIFIDAPSVLQAADARILADLCDQIILVVPYGKVHADAVSRSIDILGQKKLVGVVLNEM